MLRRVSRRTPGKSCSCLFVLLMLSSGLLHGQSEREIPSPPNVPKGAPDFSLPPRVIQPPTRDPLPIFPRSPVATPGTIGFPQMARAAGIIFSGTVTTIARHPATLGQPVETVSITFHVENAIRGATPGNDLSISEWMGLWSSGQRYRVGERVLLFLYPPSKLGLTSCVAAPVGRFHIDPLGRVLLSAQQLAALRTDPVLGGKSRATFSDFALAVQKASEEE
jgi:hypothetical protein